MKDCVLITLDIQHTQSMAPLKTFDSFCDSSRANNTYGVGTEVGILTNSKTRANQLRLLCIAGNQMRKALFVCNSVELTR